MTDHLPPGYLALPRSDQPAPTIMLVHAWWGLNDFFKQMCDRLAQAGFVVFAPDLYGGKVATTIEQAEIYRNEFDATWKDALAMLRRTVTTLRQHPRANQQPIGVIAVSLGVYFALELTDTLPEDIGAAVVLYGTREGGYAGTKGAIQAHFAGNDDFEPQSEVDKMEVGLQAAGVDYTFYTYPNTGHWFFESDRPDAYNAEAAELVWERMLSFLKAKL
jgi:carboxymethylenebutenolidase